MTPFFLSPTAEIFRTISQAASYHIDDIAAVPNKAPNDQTDCGRRQKKLVDGKSVVMVEVPRTTESEGGVSEDFGTGLPTRLSKKCSRFFDVSSKVFSATLEMEGISVQVDLIGNDPPYNSRRDSGQPGSE